MNLKQKLKQGLKEITPIDCYKTAAALLIIYCGTKLFMLFYMDYVATLILTVAFLESQGKTEFTKQLPAVVKASTYYIKGLIVGITIYLIIGLNKKLKTKRRVK